MATAPSYMGQQVTPRENGLIENLMDFSFQRLVTPRMLKMLYGVHLLIGFVAIVVVVKRRRNAPPAAEAANLTTAEEARLCELLREES